MPSRPTGTSLPTGARRPRGVCVRNRGAHPNSPRTATPRGSPQAVKPARRLVVTHTDRSHRTQSVRCDPSSPRLPPHENAPSYQNEKARTD
jgi:hypothetical protein